jgi:hypothetical protein
MTTHDILSSIATVKTPVQALVFMAALLLMGYAIKRNGRLSLILKKLRERPEGSRGDDLVLAEMQAPVPPDMTAEQYLRFRKQQNYFFLVSVFLVACLVIAPLAVFRRPPPGRESNIRVGGSNNGTIRIDNAPIPEVDPRHQGTAVVR